MNLLTNVKQIVSKSINGNSCSYKESVEVMHFVKDHFEFVDHFGSDSVSSETSSILDSIKQTFPNEYLEGLENAFTESFYSI